MNTFPHFGVVQRVRKRGLSSAGKTRDVLNAPNLTRCLRTGLRSDPPLTPTPSSRLDLGVPADALFKGFILAIVANEIADQPASERLTYGPVRVQVLSAVFSTVLLLVLSFSLVYSVYFHIYGEFSLSVHTYSNLFCGRRCIVEARFYVGVAVDPPSRFCVETTRRDLLHAIVLSGYAIRHAQYRKT